MRSEFFTSKRILASYQHLSKTERATLDRLLLRGGQATMAAVRSTQRERDRLFGGHMHAFRPFQFKGHIPKPSS